VGTIDTSADNVPVNILLVDDSLSNLLALEVVLRRRDYRLVSVTSGTAALDCLRRESYAVILLDVMMPGMDGFECAKKIKALEHGSETPIIFVTAIAAESGYVAKGYAHGAADYLTKPLDEDEVRAKVAIFVDLYRQKQSLRRLNSELERRAEARAKELAASNERFRLFVEGVHEYGFIQLDAEGNFITWNAGAERLLGYTVDEIIGLPFARIFTPQDVEGGVPEEELALARERGHADDTRWHQRKDGSRFWAHGVTTALRDETGNIRGFAKVLRDYTDSKLAEEDRRQSQRWFESVFDLVPLGVVIFELETGEAVFINKTAHKMTGGRCPELLPSDDNVEYYATDISGQRIPRSEMPRHRTMRGERLSGFEMIWHWTGGSSALNVYSTPLPPMHGNPSRGLLVFQDVTERMRVEVALKENRERLASIQESADIAGWDWNIRTNEVTWSGAVEEVYGNVPSTFQEFWETVLPDDRPSVSESIRQATAGSGNYEAEFRIARGDGSVRWLLGRGKVVRDIEGQAIRMLGINMDITKRRLAEEAQARLAAIVASSDDAIISTTIDGVISTWNDGAENIFGYTAAEASGQPISMLVPRDRLDEEQLILAKVLSGEGISHYETVRVRKDGSPVQVSLSVSPIRDERGKIVGIAKIARDITQQKQVEEELRKAKEAAEAANKAKSQFLAAMSHEIRTPLNSIVGFAEMLDEPQLTAGDRRDFVATIRRNGQLLGQLIDDILDLAKVEAGKLSVERSKCQLPLILADIEHLLGQQARSKGVDLEVKSTAPVPEWITTDPIRLRQILFNIVGNAVKFTAKGKVEVLVQQTPPMEEDETGKIEFIVKDTGKGIPPEQQGKLFRPFSQADSSVSRDYGGTGLGLVLSRRLAQMLGGNVELAESGLGHGSTFTIRIDAGTTDGLVILGSKASARQIRDLKDLQPPTRILKGLRILVAEDSPDSRHLVNRVLQSGGAAVDVAKDGAEAVEKALAENYDVVLMDIGMPVRDGFAATAELREHGYKKPIIALTAFAMKEERERCLASGFNDHLSKPINCHALLERVARISGRDQNLGGGGG
jgi:PAS domain S-box-containing protein